MNTRRWSQLLAVVVVAQLALVIPAEVEGPLSGGSDVGTGRLPIRAEGPFSDLGGEDEPVHFENVSLQAGLEGYTGNYFAWGDYDGDGYQDLLVNGRRLLRNQGPPAWSFVDVTSSVGLSGTSRVNVGIWGDYDNDGDLDVYLAGGGWSESDPTRNDYLFRNDGPPGHTFTDVTSEAGGVVDDYPSVAAAWGDLDGDGFLDLYVANYENSEMTAYWPDTLWHNDGDGTFTDVSEAWGVRSVPAAPGRGVAFCDFDNDGDADVHVSNYRLKANFLWRNDGTGHLTDVAAAKGVTGDANYYQGYGPYYGHTIGSSWADWNNDGYMDIWEANLVHKYADANDIRGYICDDSKFYRNNGPPGWDFTDVRPATTIPYKPAGGSTVYVGDELYDGIAWADFDNDGDLDVFMPQVYNLHYAYSYLYINRGDGTFEDVSDDYGAQVWNTYGAAWADYDNDGDLDLVTGGLAPFGFPASVHLFRSSGNTNNWLRVVPTGSDSNRMALGTRVSVIVGNTTMTREVEGGTGSHAQMNDLPVEFGLGKATRADTVRVRFPSGHVMTFVDVDANTTLLVPEVDPGTPPDIDAEDTSPFEDEDVDLSTSSTAATAGTYTGYYWDRDGDGVFEVRTVGPAASVNWSRQGLYSPRVAVARQVDGVSFVSVSGPDVSIDVRNLPPTADAGGDRQVAEDAQLVLDGSASSDSPSDTGSLAYCWTVDGLDRGWSSDPTTSVSWPRKGAHQATLLVRDDDGAVSNDTVTITVENLAPVVGHPGDQEVEEDEEVTVQATAVDTPSDQGDLEYRIHFGDGEATGWLAEARGVHVYPRSGVKEVLVEARDGDGAVGRVTFNVTVVNVAPTAELWLDVLDLEEDEGIEVSGMALDTPSDSGGLRWSFDFGDGNATDMRRKPVQLTEHSYDRPGVYRVTLTVEDDDGAQATSWKEVQVRNLPPTLTLTGPETTVPEDEVVVLEATGLDTVSDQSRLLYIWDLGDGTVLDWSGKTRVEHAYTARGSYVVKVTVRDDDGEGMSTQMPIKVINKPPAALATQSATSVEEDEVVTFDARGSTDTPSDLPSLGHVWTSEGRTVEGQQAAFSWSEPGSHTVLLRVTDDDGEVSEKFLQVRVVNVAPQGLASVDRTEARAGEELTFTVVSLYDTPSDLETLIIVWTFGDGTLGSGAVLTHRYEEAGDFTVTVSIRDDDGASSNSFVFVSISGEEGAMVGGTDLAVVGAVLAVIVLLVVVVVLRKRQGPPATGEDGPTAGPDEAAGAGATGPVEGGSAGEGGDGTGGEGPPPDGGATPGPGGEG